MSQLWAVDDAEGLWFDDASGTLLVDPLAFTLPADFRRSPLLRNMPTCMQAWEWFRTTYPDAVVRAIVSKRGALR